jgi:hypothetical protein
MLDVREKVSPSSSSLLLILLRQVAPSNSSRDAGTDGALMWEPIKAKPTKFGSPGPQGNSRKVEQTDLRTCLGNQPRGVVGSFFSHSHSFSLSAASGMDS